ncbi:MAG TPA: 2-C-methyl-D-erythritol 4-phosphate cytidylyltransferase, partial [Candidatus Dormibacteraeota bacterium]
MQIGVIVAAAGAGIRLGRGAKALVELNGRTALARVVDLFLTLDEITCVVVVGPPSRLEPAEREVEALRPRKPVIVRPGGDTRQQSVRAGLKALEGCEYVLVHDAARPMASAALVRRVIAAAIQTGAAIPGVSLRDAVKRVEGGRLVESLDRSRLVLAQTPQGFRYSVLERAHFQAADAGVVGDDDAQLVAAAGHPVAVVPGDPANVKLTT